MHARWARDLDTGGRHDILHLDPDSSSTATALVIAIAMAGWWAPLVARFIPVGPAAQPPPPLPANRATAPTLCPVTGSPRPAAGRHLSEWPDDQRTSRPPLSNAATRADALSGQGGCQRGRHAQPAAPPFHPRTAHVTAPGGGSARPLVLGTDRSAASLTMMQRRRRCSVTGVRGGGGFPPCSMGRTAQGGGEGGHR